MYFTLPRLQACLIKDAVVFWVGLSHVLIQKQNEQCPTENGFDTDKSPNGDRCCVQSGVPGGAFSGLLLFNTGTSSLLENIKSLLIVFADVHADWQLLRQWRSKSAHWKSHLHYLINWENVWNTRVICPVQGLVFRAQESRFAGGQGFGPAEQQLSRPDGWKREYKSQGSARVWDLIRHHCGCGRKH